MAQVHGGRLVAQALRRHGVQHVFTHPGSHIQAIYDGCLDEGIAVVDTRHEQTAGHAAEGVARMTGRAGVALVSAGPGATNVVTAIANARRAGLPLVCIGGTAPQELSHMGSFQDFDASYLFAPITKWSARCTTPSRLIEYVDSAFNRAQAGAPGPVYLEVPLDVLMAFADDETPRTAPQVAPRPGPSEQQLVALGEMLRRAGKPVVLVGSQLGLSPASTVLERFCDRVEVPIYLNGMARGALPVGHSCLFTHTRKQALGQADLIVLCGTEFDFRVEYGSADVWNPKATVVHVNLEAETLGHNRAVDLAIQSDSGLLFEGILRVVPKKSCPEWMSSLRELEAQAAAAFETELGNSEGLTAQKVCLEVSKRLGGRDAVITDGGEFGSVARRSISVGWPQRWLDAGPLGTPGVGPGFAMAAALSEPEGRAVLLSGDGAFGFHAMDFEAIVRHGLRVVTIIGNDAGFAQTRNSQVALYGKERVVATDLEHARYDKVVTALGGAGFWVESEDDLGEALDQAFASELPACVNVKL